MNDRLVLLLACVLSVLTLACRPAGDTSRSSGATPAAAATGAGAGSVADATPPLQGELHVFAAASLTDAFNEMGGAFQRAHPGVTVKFNFAASTALRTQIEQGARADVFASADQVQMDNAKKAGVIDGDDCIFVKNRLVVIYPTANPGRLATLQDLAKPGLKLVLTDKNVPIGAYARTALAKMSADPGFGPDFSRKVLANLKSEEANVRAVVTKVQLGEADAGIVYASDVTPTVTRDVQRIDIPEQFNTVAVYPIAVVADAPNKPAARAFIAFVRSATGQDILRKWNFIVDQETGAARVPPGHAAPAAVQRPHAIHCSLDSARPDPSHSPSGLSTTCMTTGAGSPSRSPRCLGIAGTICCPPLPGAASAMTAPM